MNSGRTILVSILLFLVVINKENCFSQITPNYIYNNACAGLPCHFVNTITIINDTLASTLWDFGDPSSGTQNTSSSPNPSHIFSTTGLYPVKLLVINNSGVMDSIIQSVQIFGTPIANFSANSPCVGAQVFFSDSSTAPFPEVISIWNWDFGDMTTSNLPNPSNLYGIADTFNVQLMVTTANGCKSVVFKQVKVNDFPHVVIGSDLVACKNVPEQFFDNSTVVNGVISKWHWNFGGASDTSNLKNPYFTFISTGTFPIILSFTSDANCTTADTVLVVVKDHPVPAFLISPQAGYPPLDVSFSNASTTDAVTFSWDFDDGNSSSIKSPMHTYTDLGTFNPCMTAISADGCAASICHSLQVAKPIHDMAVIKLLTSEQGSTLSLTARIANFGNSEITSADLEVSLGGNFSVTEHVSDTLKPGKDRLYKFNANFEINPNDKERFVCVAAQITNETDQAPLNNEQCVSLAGGFHVMPPSPNPAKSTVKLQFILPESGNIEVRVYDQLGNRVITEQNTDAPAGLNILLLDVSSIRKGIYTCKTSFGGKTDVRQIIKY